MSDYPIPDTALDDRLAFVGTAGSGKTYAAGTAVEKLLATGARVVIVDPLDVWFGLRLNADGKSAGFPVVIFGGAHGDLALTENAGALIGETVAGMAESCIVSLSALGTKASERRFMLAFLTALYRQTSGSPVHLVFDEADMWAPQRLMDRDGDAARLLGQMETIVRRGRVKGFIPWLITQRPAVLSKDVLSQADGLVAMKLTSSQDRDALGAWIEGQADRAEEKRMLARLPQLGRGESIVWIPGRGVLTEAAFPAKATFDSSRTPKRGEKRSAAMLKPIDISALSARLATIEQEAEANDPKALRAEIARLKAARPADDSALRAEVHRLGQAVVQANAAAADAEARGFAEGALAGRKQVLGLIRSAIDALVSTVDRLDSESAPMPLTSKEFDRIAAPPPRLAPAFVSPPINRRKCGGCGCADIGAERRILAVLAAAYPAGMSEAQWAVAAGMKRSGGTWGTYKSRLRTAGRIEQAGSLWRATEAGMMDVGENIEPLPARGQALVEYWAERIPGAASMLRTLARAYPKTLSKEALAGALDMTPTGGTFGTYLSRLRSPGLIERSGDGFRASPDLMGGAA